MDNKKTKQIRTVEEIQKEQINTLDEFALLSKEIMDKEALRDRVYGTLVNLEHEKKEAEKFWSFIQETRPRQSSSNPSVPVDFVMLFRLE